MLHRPADSRLLSNLLSHEREYVRALHSQLDYGQASLASFSAYAAASPPPASHAISSVATALVGAHDALRGYVLAVEEWCEQLKILKDMEDEVGTIARDREILVDRLIKASKSNNPKRRSLLPSSNNNTLGSPTFSGSNNTLDQLSFNNSKLNLAQNELQACETHLTEKERILAQMRDSCLVGGLKMRCKALTECGIKWSEAGKAGLQGLDESTSRGAFDRTGVFTQKPLPDINYPYQRPSSDISSSLAPSQSASQIFHPDATSDQYHPGVSSSTGHGQGTRAAPEADIRDGSQFKLTLPAAYAISDEDHYTPPQARRTDEDEVGGSSVEEDGTDERQYEVHENPLFASKAKPKQHGSKTHLPLKKPKHANSDSATVLPASASAPLPTSARQQQQTPDRFGTSSSGQAYSDGHQDSPRTRKRSTFLGRGVGALTGIFHKRDRSVSEPGDSHSPPPSPTTKKGKWRTRTDRRLKKAAAGGKGDDSSDDELAGAVSAPASVQASAVPSYLMPSLAAKAQLESRAHPSGKEGGGPATKRAPSTGRKLRKASDPHASAQRKASGSEGNVQAPRPSGEAKKPDVNAASRGQQAATAAANGFTVSPLSSASVSRSSTVRSESTIRSGSSDRPASFELPRQRTGAGAKGRRRTSLGHVSSPPTTGPGQMSLLSIVEDVTRSNRSAWLQANPNNLLIEVKAPKSVYETLHIDAGPASVTSSMQTQSEVAGTMREPPLRYPVVNMNYLRRNSLVASSSEPSLPLKRLPPTPTPGPRPAMKTPLRSALRNRSASPSEATLTPPRASSPARKTRMAEGNGGSRAGRVTERPPAVCHDSAGSSVKDSDTSSMASAYETGHEEFDSGPPTPSGQPKASQPSTSNEQHSLPNGHITSEVKSADSHVSGSSTGGTATPPSRRKSVRVSLKPTFSPTPPALTDYEEDHSPWAPAPPGKGKEEQEGGWVSRKSGESVWDESSDEDEEYSRAKEMLSRASSRLEKVYKGRV